MFTEYLYQVFRRGHSVEYFVEGGRSRTGRLLPARTGLLQMTLDAHRRGLPRPVAFIPVYFGYEKLVEASGYVDEMRGADKKNESIGDILRSLKLVRQSFGAAQVSFGAPLVLDDFLRDCDEAASPVKELGARILRGINACAAVNGMNLISLATLSMPRHAIRGRRSGGADRLVPGPAAPGCGAPSASPSPTRRRSRSSSAPNASVC